MRQHLDADSATQSVDGSQVRDRVTSDRLADEIGTLPRPHATAPIVERIREWVDWFGLTRLLTSAVAVVVVCAGAWFLVRTPSPPSEASLPVASGSPTGPAVTLAVAPTPPGPSTTATSGPVIVHVAGAVIVPGVYELGPGSRVADAVEGAGGASDDADLGRINLAAPLLDGGQIYVPAVGEDGLLLPPPGSASESAAAESMPSGPVDVNRASAGELESLPGVGPATAAAIIAERERNGPFASFDDLERVAGIGPAKLAGLVGLVIT